MPSATRLTLYHLNPHENTDGRAWHYDCFVIIADVGRHLEWNKGVPPHFLPPCERANRCASAAPERQNRYTLPDGAHNSGSPVACARRNCPKWRRLIAARTWKCRGARAAT